MRPKPLGLAAIEAESGSPRRYSMTKYGRGESVVMPASKTLTRLGWWS